MPVPLDNVTQLTMTDMAQKHRFMICDRQQLFASGLAELLQKDLPTDDVQIVNHPQELQLQLKATPPDLLILSTDLPAISLPQLLSHIRSQNPKLPILLISAVFDLRFLRKGDELGANGYIVKTHSQKHLIQACTRLLQGETYFPEELHEDTSVAPPGSVTQKPLTLREEEVLKLISQGLNTRQVAEALRISVKTAESHRKNIMNKLHLHSVAELTKHALVKGLTEL